MSQLNKRKPKPSLQDLPNKFQWTKQACKVLRSKWLLKWCNQLYKILTALLQRFLCSKIHKTILQGSKLLFSKYQCSLTEWKRESLSVKLRKIWKIWSFPFLEWRLKKRFPLSKLKLGKTSKKTSLNERDFLKKWTKDFKILSESSLLSWLKYVTHSTRK